MESRRPIERFLENDSQGYVGPVMFRCDMIKVLRGQIQLETKEGNFFFPPQVEKEYDWRYGQAQKAPHITTLHTLAQKR